MRRTWRRTATKDRENRLIADHNSRQCTQYDDIKYSGGHYSVGLLIIVLYQILTNQNALVNAKH